MLEDPQPVASSPADRASVRRIDWVEIMAGLWLEKGAALARRIEGPSNNSHGHGRRPGEGIPRTVPSRKNALWGP